MAERHSALTGHNQPGHFGAEQSCGIQLQEIADLQLHQVAAWPDTIDIVGRQAADAAGLSGFSEPGCASGDAQRAMLRVEPLKWWLLGVQPPSLDAQLGASLDLSHARVRVRVSGNDAAMLLNRFLPVDLREHKFPTGRLATSAMHHVSITLWRNELGYDLFIPRGYALSSWQVLFESALQFGVEVV